MGVLSVLENDSVGVVGVSESGWSYFTASQEGGWDQQITLSRFCSRASPGAGHWPRLTFAPKRPLQLAPVGTRWRLLIGCDAERLTRDNLLGYVSPREQPIKKAPA